MAKHTPGPWRVFTTPDNTKIIGIGEQSGDGIADCGFGVWRGGSEEARANALLMAAAPDLLAALRMVRAALYDTGGLKRGGGIQDVVEIAIAKAEGR